VSENRVLRRIQVFGPKWDDIIGGWRKLHNEALHNLYSSPTIRMIKSRKMGWAGYVSRMGEKGSPYRLEKPEGKRPLERSRRRWRMILKLFLYK
jgi:hypothetical protein